MDVPVGSLALISPTFTLLATSVTAKVYRVGKYAIKSISEAWITFIVREIIVSELLTHPNLHHIVRVFGTPDVIHLQSKYYKTTLQALCPIDIADVPLYAGGIAAGLQYLHAAGFVHCDLKSANIFVDADSREIVIGDLGSAALSNFECEQLMQTSYVRAPQSYKSFHIDKSMDIWSFGILLLEMAGVPVMHMNSHDIGFLQFDALYVVPKRSRAVYPYGGKVIITAETDNIRPKLITNMQRRARVTQLLQIWNVAYVPQVDIICQCLQHRPDDRPTAHELCVLFGRAAITPAENLIELNTLCTGTLENAVKICTWMRQHLPLRMQPVVGEITKYLLGNIDTWHTYYYAMLSALTQGEKYETIAAAMAAEVLVEVSESVSASDNCLI